MSTPGYLWDLEEAVEDAIVTLLSASVSRVAMIIPARSVVAAKYPLVVVEAGESDNANDAATFNGRRRMKVDVHVVTEAVNQSQELGQEEATETAREQHRAIKRQVIGMLASTQLHDELNEQQPVGVLFSMAHMTGQARETGDAKLVTIQTLDIIAQPKEA